MNMNDKRFGFWDSVVTGFLVAIIVGGFAFGYWINHIGALCR